MRVRDLDGIAKIEVEKDQLSVFEDKILDEISGKFKLIGFLSVQIDPEGYSPGKINVFTD